jgi:hypothetical protein
LTDIVRRHCQESIESNKRLAVVDYDSGLTFVSRARAGSFSLSLSRSNQSINIIIFITVNLPQSKRKL